jgi:DNA-binding Xre family transcriptional regulator
LAYDVGMTLARVGDIPDSAFTIQCMADRNTSSVYTARGAVEGEDWAAVAVALNERMAARRVGQQELSDLSGVSVSTLRQVQHGAGRRVQNKTLAAISRALDWSEDHLTSVLLSSPAQASGSARTAGGDAVLEALHRVERRLDDLAGQLADLKSAVTDRGGGGAAGYGRSDAARR